jgi:GGDEF domain-containing protein
MNKSDYDDLPPHARELLHQAPADWVQLPPSVIRRSVRDAFASLERLGLIETRTLNTAPNVTIQWRAAPGTHPDPAEARTAQEIERAPSSASGTGAVSFRSHAEQALARMAGTDAMAAVLWLGISLMDDAGSGSGRTANEALLEAAEARVRLCIRDNDLAGRLGGGLVVLQSGLKQLKPAEAMARRLVEVLGKPSEPDGRDATPRLSIGIAVAPRDGLDLDTLFAKAQRAAMQARSEGPVAHGFLEAGRAPRRHDAM